MLMDGIALGYLSILVIWDARTKELPVKLLGLGTILAVGMAVFRLSTGTCSCAELFMGAAPGAVLLILAWLTKSVGLGDGIVLLQLDLFLLLERLVMTFAVSLTAIGCFALMLLLFKKSGKDLRLPYMPFLWLGCLSARLICG